ncbi:MAG: hypothetical protein JXA74_05985 [Anaerolineae bacterium]|nr:hypothetical protein [Anaerolineae bacterium]
MRKRVLVGAGVLLLIIAAAAGGFFVGTLVGEARAEAARQQAARDRPAGWVGAFPRTPGAPQGGTEGGPRMGGGGAMGTIAAIEGNALTLATQGGDVRVIATDTTLVEKYLSVGVDQLAVGEQVIVSGSQGDDGSLTARSIRVMQASLP